jgi:RNA polymerase sigma factor (sigma-70 family)
MAAHEARFAEIYENYNRHVRAYCRRRTTADRVDDAVADTFLTAWRRINDVPDGSDALPWLYGVAFKVLGHQWRSRSRKAKLAEKLRSMGVEPLRQPEEQVVVNEESRQVLDAIENLNKTDKEILLLAAWEDMAHADIAEILGIQVGAVRQRFYQARKNLTREYNRLERRQAQSPAAQKGGAW